MRTLIPAAALILALTGCVSSVLVGPTQPVTVGQTTVTVAGIDGYNADAVRSPDPNGPNVFVTNNTLVVDEEPVRPMASHDRVVVVWRLPASDSSPYTFADDNAIKLQAGPSNPLPQDLSCGVVGQKKKSFVCTYTKPEAPRQWKYSLRVKNRAGTDPTPLDPWVHQN